MANASISVPLDPETARVFGAAGTEDRQKIQALLGLWARELAVNPAPPLERILDEAGQKARQRGLTEAMLEDLLKDA